MSKFTQEQLSSMASPVSGAEDASIQNVVSMVRDAIDEREELKGLDIEVFLQGSYKNNTNVRLNSDVDINVCLKSTFYYHLPQGKTKEQYGITDSNYLYHTFKSAVTRALMAKFGSANVVRKNKCIHIKENTYHHDADVVPTFEYRLYGNYGVADYGVKFITDANQVIINYPKQQIDNGISKNNRTGRRFKNTVRIIKRIRYKMIDEKEAINSN